jgi:hypothetical protein
LEAIKGVNADIKIIIIDQRVVSRGREITHRFMTGMRRL